MSKKAPTPFGAGAFAYAVRSRNCGSKRYILSGCGSQIGNDLAKTRYADSQAIGKITRQSDPIPAATYFYTIMKRVLGKRDTNLTIEQGKRSCEKEPHPDGPNYHPYQTLIHTQFLLPTVSQTLSCENTYSPASAYLTYAEQRRHETAGWNFFPRPAAFLADT